MPAVIASAGFKMLWFCKIGPPPIVAVERGIESFGLGFVNLSKPILMNRVKVLCAAVRPLKTKRIPHVESHERGDDNAGFVDRRR